MGKVFLYGGDYMFTFKVSDRIYLKLLSDNDSKDLFMLIDANRNYLRKWLSWVDGIRDILDVKSFIKKAKEQYSNNNGFQAGVWYENELVGIIGLNEIDWTNKKTTIGYWLGEGYQGKGIIIESSKALINYGLKVLKLNKIEIHCAEENHKSRAIPESLKFKQEGLIRDAQWLYDHYVSHIIYGCIKDEWAN